MKRLLLLGGGHAHVHVLRALARHAPRDTLAMLVTPHERQMYSGMVPGLVAGHYHTDQCAIPLAPLAAAARVRFVQGEAAALDADQRRITLADGSSVDFDLLSIDTGPVMDQGAIPGAREHGLFVRPIEDFVQGLKRVLKLASERPIDSVVIGGGAAGVELAMALAWRLESNAALDGRVALVAGAAGLLDGFPVGVRRKAAAALRRRRIAVFNENCSAIAADGVSLASGARLACEAPLLAIGTSAPRWLADSHLTLDERGFVATGPTLQSTSHDDVFAAGDVATRIDAPHPKSGVYAVRAGPPLAHNLCRYLERGELKTYAPQRRALYLLSLGERRALASWGRWSVEGHSVWRWKDRIDCKFVARYGGGANIDR